MLKWGLNFVFFHVSSQLCQHYLCQTIFLTELECWYVIYWALIYIISRLYSVPLICLSSPQPVPYCFDYSGFSVSFNNWQGRSVPLLFVFFWGCGCGEWSILERSGLFSDVYSFKWTLRSFCQDKSKEKKHLVFPLEGHPCSSHVSFQAHTCHSIGLL